MCSFQILALVKRAHTLKSTIFFFFTNVSAFFFSFFKRMHALNLGAHKPFRHMLLDCQQIVKVNTFKLGNDQTASHLFDKYPI